MGCGGRVALICAAWALCLRHELRLLPSLSESFGSELNPAVVALVMTSFFVVLVALALRRTPMLASRRWIWFGAVSYPLYVIYQNVGYMVFNRIGATVDQRVTFWAVIAAGIATALIVHIVAEKPTAGALKRSLTRTLDALQRHAPTLPTRRQRDTQHDSLTSGAPRT
ncbi:acyltransferase [Burkholderia multivorans]|nr:acyltransferase [Burkholderia multivorans]